MLRKPRGHMGIRPGWGMTTTGGLYIETHSLFTRARRRSLPSPRGLGPAARLGRAAAGAGRALRAADAVGCTAVFRGRRGGGHLLPSCCLPCGEGRQGTKKDACYVCASLTRTFPRLPFCLLSLSPWAKRAHQALRRELFGVLVFPFCF